MTEICEGLRAMAGKLNHLGLEKAPAKSTASDGMAIATTSSLKMFILDWYTTIKVFCPTAGHLGSPLKKYY